MSFYLHEHQDAKLEAALARIQGSLPEGQILTTSHGCGKKLRQAGSEETRKMFKLGHQNSTNKSKKLSGTVDANKGLLTRTSKLWISTHFSSAL